MADITTLHYLVVAAALLCWCDWCAHAPQRGDCADVDRVDSERGEPEPGGVFAHVGNLHGQMFAIFIVVDAAAEAAAGLGILIAFFRNRETINVDEIDLLKW